MEDVEDLARQHTFAAMQALVDIMNDSNSGLAQIAAVNAILDIGWGKPTREPIEPAEVPEIRIMWRGPDCRLK